MRHNAIRDITMGTIIGDALGSGVDGLGKGHIRAIFGGIAGYIDPARGLKGKMERWRMPGLYTSLGQLLLITAMSAGMHRRAPQGIVRHLQELIGRMPGAGDVDHGIFRSPDFIERRFINASAGTAESSIPSIPGLRLLPLAASLLPLRTDRETAILTLISSFTRDPATAAGALLFGRILELLCGDDTPPEGTLLFEAAIVAAGDCSSAVREAHHRVFDAGINSDSLLRSLELYGILCSGVKDARSLASAEEFLCAQVNPLLTNPVRRATVNHPFLALPFVLSLCTIMSHDPHGMLFTVAAEGGAASPCTALAGALLGALHGIDAFTPVLRDTLVNKQRIQSIAASLQRGAVTADDIDRFITAEAQLTKKEAEERRARMKHAPKRERPRPSDRRRESDLARPVIESWTKLDRARWKREKRRSGVDPNSREDHEDD
ncbi:MAG: hypothetical protein JXA20_04515 [Spirochaetes bacterium]|nr:hypothetical protein [Spirochaetota bacterium]